MRRPLTTAKLPLSPPQPEDALAQKVNAAFGSVLQNLDQAVTFARNQSKKAAPPTAPTVAFGAAAKPSPFGSGANATPVGAFGSRPTTFGQPSTSASAFGAPAAFGAPSAFGSTSAPSAFGSKPFGAPSAFGQTQPVSAFGQSASGSAFGSSTATGSGGGGFGAFGTPAASTSAAFGSTQQPASAFGQSSAFGATGPAKSAFGGGTGGFSAFGEVALTFPWKSSLADDSVNRDCRRGAEHPSLTFWRRKARDHHISFRTIHCTRRNCFCLRRTLRVRAARVNQYSLRSISLRYPI